VTPFVVFSLPRSRSAWLSTVLCSSGRLVGHDIGINCKTPEDFISELTSRGGTCETGASFAWREIRKVFPYAPFVVILRNPKDVDESLQKFGLAGYLPELEKRYEELIEISSQPNVFSCRYEDLSSSEIISDLYRHCTGQESSLDWINKLQDTNIQVDMGRRISTLSQNKTQIDLLKQQINERISRDSYDIKVETWSSDLWRDAKQSAESHFVEVDGGIEPNRKFVLDEDLMQNLQDAGLLLIVTARKNGQFIGYFTWQISPDIESKGLLIAQQGAWYVNPGHPRIAFKMFDKSVDELKRRGVKCIFPHHRTQGRGANIGKFFEKRGAKLIQHTYSLWIGEDECRV
jgi:hypothetical protein